MSNKATQFKPGQSGNPKGRPKRKWTWAGLMEKYAEEELEGEKGKVKDKVVKRVFELAKRGDMTAAKELFNRMDGMPKQSTDITSKGDKLDSLVIIKDGSKT